MPQDMPPAGGYEAVQYKRNIPTRGFRPRNLIIGVVGVMVWSWYKWIKGSREMNELAREKVWSRIYIAPLLQAEEDRDQVRRHLADLAREKALLGGNFSPYNKDVFVRPTYAIVPEVSREK